MVKRMKDEVGVIYKHVKKNTPGVLFAQRLWVSLEKQRSHWERQKKPGNFKIIFWEKLQEVWSRVFYYFYIIINENIFLNLFSDFSLLWIGKQLIIVYWSCILKPCWNHLIVFLIFLFCVDVLGISTYKIRSSIEIILCILF